MPELTEILKAKIGKDSKSKTYIASKLGVSEKTVENYMNGKRSPKPDRLIKLAKLLDFDLSELSEQNVPYGTKKEEIERSGIASESLAAYGNGQKQFHSIAEGDLLKAVIMLTESNKGLVDSNKTITETNQTIANTNKILAQKLMREGVIENDGAEKSLDVPAILPVILEAMAEIGSGHRWHSKEEAAAELGRRMLRQTADKEKTADTPTGANK